MKLRTVAKACGLAVVAGAMGGIRAAAVEFTVHIFRDLVRSGDIQVVLGHSFVAGVDKTLN